MFTEASALAAAPSDPVGPIYQCSYNLAAMPSTLDACAQRAKLTHRYRPHPATVKSDSVFKFATVTLVLHSVEILNGATFLALYGQFMAPGSIVTFQASGSHQRDTYHGREFDSSASIQAPPDANSCHAQYSSFSFGKDSEGLGGNAESGVIQILIWAIFS